MSVPGPAERRRRLAGTTVIVAACLFSLGGLALLYVYAGVRDAQGSPDALALALLRADLDRTPGDAALRVKLIRELLALGMYADAERTLPPLLEARTTRPDAALLPLDVALGAWRAIPAGMPERQAARSRALARLEAFLPRQATVGDLTRAARAARELGRTDLAARADERAAALEPDPRRSMDLGLGAVDAYRAADQGEEALRVAEKLASRFPGERKVLERALAIALAQNDPQRARRFGERLLSMGTVDAVSLGRQLDLELAAGDLAGASTTAERLVSVAPRDPRSRLRAARVALWAGEPRRALLHWTWLARQRGSLRHIDEALALAGALRDEASVAALLQLRALEQPLSAAALAELTRALESTAAPRSVVATLKHYVAVRPTNRDGWEALAGAQERRRDLGGALATRLEIAGRFGADLGSSVAVAKLQWALGRREEALSELRPWIDSAPRARFDYWEVLAEIAWQQEADAPALRAYGALWEGGHLDATGAERLLVLAREAGRTDEVLRIGWLGWSRMRHRRLLLLAMDEAARTGRWSDVERMAADAVSSGADFTGVPAFWMLRARAAERAGRTPQAIEAYRRVLAADPKSRAARSGMLWLLSETQQQGVLSRYLALWADDAPGDPELSLAYGAGVQAMRGSPPPASALPAAAGADVTAESVGGVALAQQRAFVRTPIPGGDLELRQGLIVALPGDGPRQLPGAEKRVLVQARLTGASGHTEIAAGVSMRPDARVLQAGVARMQRLSTAGEVRIEAFLHEPADESLALRMEAVRTRIGGSAAVSEGGAYQRLAVDWKAWSTRSGADIGTGAAANLEIGWRARDPDFVVRLQGGYQRNRMSGAIPGPLAPFANGASAILPDQLAAVGVGAGVAQVPAGPLRLAADLWIGSVGPPFRPAFRVQGAVALSPFRNAELAGAAFGANDRLDVGGNYGVSVSLAHRFGL